MQAKHHMKKSIKSSPLTENFRRQRNLDHITVIKIWNFSGQTDVGNEEIDSRLKN